MSEYKSLRDAYGEALVELACEDERIVVLDADLSSSTRTSRFSSKFGGRFFNVGVSEQDLIGTAAGLAAAGKIAFASSFAVFATGRAYCQIRLAVCMARNNVKIVATHGGITVGEDGATHQALEDIALMRALPNMIVIAPADAHETRAAVRAVAGFHGPAYIRLPREKYPVIYTGETEFKIGKAKFHGHGEDAAIVACGIMVHKALEARDKLALEGLRVTVVNMSTIKPIDGDALLQAARCSGAIVTAEDHSVIGGLGGAVAEFLGETCPVPIERVGIRDEFGVSGKPEELMEIFGLTARDLCSAVKRAIARKRQGAMAADGRIESRK